MKKRTFSVTVLAFALILTGCASGASSVSGQDSAVLNISEDDRAIEKAYAISEYVTEKSDGLVSVPYVEIPTHRLADGSVHYGVHYNVFVTKRSDLLTNSDREKVQELVADVLRLTTRHVIEPESSEVMTHMGVQLFDADAWTYGGHLKGDITVFEASRGNLTQVDDDAHYTQWLRAAFQSKQVIIPESALSNLNR